MAGFRMWSPDSPANFASAEPGVETRMVALFSGFDYYPRSHERGVTLFRKGYDAKIDDRRCSWPCCLRQEQKGFVPAGMYWLQIQEIW